MTVAMPGIPVRNRIRSAVGGLFRRPMIRAKDRFLHSATALCEQTQQETLQRLLSLNQASTFCRERELHAGMSVRDFRKRAAITDYEDYRPYIEQMRGGNHGALLGPDNRLLMYALSSGTTAQPKLIPITDQFIKDYRRGWQHWGIATHQDHSSMKHLKMVQVSGCRDQWKAEDGTPCGRISGLVTAMQRRIVRKLYAVPAPVCNITEPNDKQHAVARFAYADPFVGMLITANSATLLRLINDTCPESIVRDIHDGTLTGESVESVTRGQLRRYMHPNRPRAQQLQAVLDKHGHLAPQACWPRMTCLGVWSGGSAGTYLPELLSSFGNISIRDHGLHASEGRMTIPFQSGTPAGVLDIESHFFEFLPVEDAESEQAETLLAHELQEGSDYYILLTTSSGLSRYNIFDVVRCTGFVGTTPLLEFRNKGAHISSITGEKISEAQVVESVSTACQSDQVRLAQFTMTPAWGSPPHYLLYLQTADQSPTSLPDQFATTCDRMLRQQNCEYDDKRTSGRLGPIQCHVLADDVWTTFRQSRLTKSGGSAEQYKHPCLLPDAAFENKFAVAAGITIRKPA